MSCHLVLYLITSSFHRLSGTLCSPHLATNLSWTTLDTAPLALPKEATGPKQEPRWARECVCDGTRGCWACTRGSPMGPSLGDPGSSSFPGRTAKYISDMGQDLRWCGIRLKDDVQINRRNVKGNCLPDPELSLGRQLLVLITQRRVLLSDHHLFIQQAFLSLPLKSSSSSLPWRARWTWQLSTKE